MVVARTFRLTSRLRAARTFHPRGHVLRGRLDVTPEASYLGAVGPAAVLARVSRGVGVPVGLPDFNGLALRIPDAHGPGADQDVLLVSAGSRPGARHVLRPVRTWDGRLSSILPFETERGLVLLGARLRDAGGGSLPDLDAVVDAARRAALQVELAAAGARGPWRTVATGLLRDEGDGDPPSLGFDPWNTGPGLRPWSGLNRLRVPAYRGSRAGRGAPADRTETAQAVVEDDRTGHQ